MSASREPFPRGTFIRLPDGFCCQITGDPLGEGGGSLIYPVCRVHMEERSGLQVLQFRFYFAQRQQYRQGLLVQLRKSLDHRSDHKRRGS